MLTGRLRRLLRTVCQTASPELGHVDIRQVLFVAGAARRGARASIRPLGGESDPRRPHVVLAGRTMRYEVCLRPGFFRLAAPEERLDVLIHELWHIDPSFDGSLAPARRHRASNRVESEAFVRQVRERLSRLTLDPILGHRGELWMPTWLDRPPTLIPPGTGFRRRYGRRDLCRGVVRMK